MENICKKLEEVLEEQTVIIFILIVCNITLVGWIFGIFNTNGVIANLCIVDTILIVCVIKHLARWKLRTDSILLKSISSFDLKPAREREDCTETPFSNLYIHHWKKVHFNRSPEFPLERLAYLHSLLHNCSERHLYFLRNSQLKQLAVKKASSKHCDDDYHPQKLVTDYSGCYIHRRSCFFRNRNVCEAGKKQFTKFVDHRKREDEFIYSMLYEEEKRKLNEMSLNDNNSDDKPESDDMCPEDSSKNYFKSMKTAMGSIVKSFKPKSLSKAKESSKKMISYK